MPAAVATVAVHGNHEGGGSGWRRHSLKHEAVDMEKLGSGWYHVSAAAALLDPE